MTTEDDFSPAAVKAALVDTFTVGYRRLVGEGRGVEFARPALDLSRYLRRLPDDDDRLVQLAKLVPNTAALLALIPEDEPPTLPNGICEPFLSHLIHRARVSRNLPIEPMKLYVHLPVRVAATIVRSGRFEPWQMLTTADGQVDCCVFWDVPPRGWETTRTNRGYVHGRRPARRRRGCADSR